MKNEPIKKKEKERSNINVLALIIGTILLIAICIGAFFLGRWFIAKSSTKQDDTVETNNGEATTNKLLELLNKNINKTKMGEEAPANEVTSFSYQEKHFYISGYNGDTVYQYDLDLSSQSLSTTKDALEYINNNDIEGKYDITLNRCVPYQSNEFVNKYITGGVTGKYHVGTFGNEQYVFATLLKGEQITIINGDTLSDTLNVSYSPLTISSGNPLFDVYQYLASH